MLSATLLLHVCVFFDTISIPFVCLKPPNLQKSFTLAIIVIQITSTSSEC